MSDQDFVSTRPMMVPHHVAPLSRRDWLLRAGGGFGALALLDLMTREATAEADAEAKAGSPTTASVRDSSLVWKRPATARSVIFLFMEGGPSHIDLFDPKPALDQLAGKPLPPSFKPVITPMGEFHSPVLASKRTWKQHGKSGLWVSDWLPHIATCVDDLAVIRSCWSNGLNHVGGVCQMNTGSILGGRPSLGSWVSYGLGTENQNLPGYRRDARQSREAPVAGGPRNWGTGFMPAVVPGHAVQRRRRADRQPAHAGRARPRPPARQARIPRPAQPPPSPVAVRPDRARRPDPELRAGLPHAGRGPRGRRPGAARPPRPARSTAWTTRRPRASAVSACWPAAWSSGACGSSSSTAARGRGGTPTRTSKGTTPRTAWPWTSRSPACSRTSSGAACWTRRWSSGAASSAALPCPRKATAATTTPTASPCGWPAAASRPASSIGRTDEVGLHADRGPPARPRPPRHDPPLPGRRPHQADLSPPGPPRTAHRQRGAGL